MRPDLNNVTTTISTPAHHDATVGAGGGAEPRRNVCMPRAAGGGSESARPGSACTYVPRSGLLVFSRRAMGQGPGPRPSFMPQKCTRRAYADFPNLLLAETLLILRLWSDLPRLHINLTLWPAHLRAYPRRQALTHCAATILVSRQLNGPRPLFKLSSVVSSSSCQRRAVQQERQSVAGACPQRLHRDFRVPLARRAD